MNNVQCYKMRAERLRECPGNWWLLLANYPNPVRYLTLDTDGDTRTAGHGTRAPGYWQCCVGW